MSVCDDLCSLFASFPRIVANFLLLVFFLSTLLFQTLILATLEYCLTRIPCLYALIQQIHRHFSKTRHLFRNNYNPWYKLGWNCWSTCIILYHKEIPSWIGFTIIIKIYTAIYAFLFLAFVLIASGSTFLYGDEGCLLFSTPSQFQARLSVNRAFVCAVVHEFIDTDVPNRDRRDCVWAGCWTLGQVSPDVMWRHEICMLLWPPWVILQLWLFFSDDIGLAA